MANIFDERNFEGVFTDRKTRETAALAADEVVKARGSVLYGKVTESGYLNFTTEKKPGDTHKILCIGTKALALLAPENEDYILEERVQDEGILYEMQKQIKFLTTELELARKGQGGTSGPQ